MRAPGEIRTVAEAGFTAAGTSASQHFPMQLREVNIVHEVGVRAEDATAQRMIVVAPSALPTLVQIKSDVVARGARGIGSPVYMSVVRRRGARLLAEQVDGLHKFANREDFSTCTFPVLSRLNALLKSLENADQEGNSREVLRQVRSSIMNGGWESYRSSDVRHLVKSILEHLGDVEEVSAKDAHAAFNRLSGLSLDPVGAPLFELAAEDDSNSEQADGREE